MTPPIMLVAEPRSGFAGHRQQHGLRYDFSSQVARFRPALSVMAGPQPPGTPSLTPPLERLYLEQPNGERLFFLRGGTPDGPPALFIHGIGGWAENWLPNLSAFEGMRWWIPDLPGFGRSSPPSKQTFMSLIDALLRLLDAAGLSRVMLVGNSLGGGMALRMALDHPDRFSHLVLATAAGIRREISPIFKLGLLPGIGEAVLGNALPVFGPRWALQFGDTSGLTTEFMEHLRAFSIQYDCRHTYLGVLREGTDSRGLRYVVTDELPQLKQPTLLAWGTRDRVLSYDHAQYALRHIPNIELVSFSGAGHYPHWEQPERFNHHVRQALLRWGVLDGLPN